MTRQSNLEPLLKAYIELTLAWSRAPVGENAARVWKSCDFLERLIRKEVELAQLG